MRRKGAKAKVNNEVVFESAKNKSYFDFGKNKTERKLLDELFKAGKIKNFTYVINPAFLKKIQPNLDNYVLFIDTRRADIYKNIKEYILNRKNQFTSYITTGDMDFILFYNSTDLIHKTIKEEILALLNEAPRGDGDDELVIGYKVKKFLMLKGERCSGHYSSSDDITLEQKINISNTSHNYISEKIVSKFGTEKKVVEFLTKLEKENILERFYVIGDAYSNKIKFIALIQYTVAGYYEKVILANKEINKFIIDFLEINTDNIKDDFYRRAEFLVLAEFSNIEEYHKWKEDIYKFSLQNKAFINIMSFAVEDTLSEIPQSIGDLREFEELCKKYNGSSSRNIFIGYPYFYDNEETGRRINLKVDSLKDQGMIIGYQNSGKTYTSLLLANRLIEHNIRVHFFDSLGGITKSINQDFPELIDKGKVNFFDFNKGDKVELYKKDGINVYKINEAFYNDFISKQFDIISESEESTGRKTNDVIFFEEAHLLFSNKELVDKLFHLIKHVGRKGFSFWFSTQTYLQFPIDENGSTLLKDLKNRIIHLIDPTEASTISEFLFGFEEKEFSNIAMLQDELKKVARGTAIVSFYQGDRQLKPIKVALKKN